MKFIKQALDNQFRSISKLEEEIFLLTRQFLMIYFLRKV
jgi:hypothetical protein